jgi:hypothetical protein
MPGGLQAMHQMKRTLTDGRVCLGGGAHRASRRALRIYTKLANKLRARYLWAVAKGALENGKAEAAPISETTPTAARTAASATGPLRTAAAACLRGQAQPLTGDAAFAPILRLEHDGLTNSWLNARPIACVILTSGHKKRPADGDSARRFSHQNIRA